MMFDAQQIARGWLAVALASAKDAALPVLSRTVFVESFAEGVRLVATDSVVLLHAFVPDVEHENDPGPGLDEVPIATAIAMDPHGRACGFLAHALKLANAAATDGGEPIEIRLRLDVADAGGQAQQQFAGLEARYVVLEQPDHERLKLRTCDGTFPAWRTVVSSFTPELATQLAFAPGVAGQIARIGNFHPYARLGLTFGGENRACQLDAVDSDPHVAGLVMPCRWDLARNRPRVDDVAAEAEAFLRQVTGTFDDPIDSDLVAAATALVVQAQLGSASMLQRKLAIPFARAAWLMDQLEKLGVVGPANGTQARDVLMTWEELDALLDDEDDGEATDG